MEKEPKKRFVREETKTPIPQKRLARKVTVTPMPEGKMERDVTVTPMPEGKLEREVKVTPQEPTPNLSEYEKIQKAFSDYRKLTKGIQGKEKRL